MPGKSAWPRCGCRSWSPAVDPGRRRGHGRVGAVVVGRVGGGSCGPVGGRARRTTLPDGGDGRAGRERSAVSWPSSVVLPAAGSGRRRGRGHAGGGRVGRPAVSGVALAEAGRLCRANNFTGQGRSPYRARALVRVVAVFYGPRPRLQGAVVDAAVRGR